MRLYLLIRCCPHRHRDVSHCGAIWGTADVALWHITEVPPASRDFRFRGHNGHTLALIPPGFSHQHDGCQVPGKGVAGNMRLIAELAATYARTGAKQLCYEGGFGPVGPDARQQAFMAGSSRSCHC